MILVLDFGSQYTQLIARRVREARVYCEILPCTVDVEQVAARKPRGIILSGGPASVYVASAPKLARGILDLHAVLLTARGEQRPHERARDLQCLKHRTPLSSQDCRSSLYAVERVAAERMLRDHG